VLQEGHRRSAVVANTRVEAVKRAREIVRSHGGGEIRVMNKAGKIVTADKVARPVKKAKTKQRVKTTEGA
jgi:hypothetical protein